jgi:hypothetical protein
LYIASSISHFFLELAAFASSSLFLSLFLAIDFCLSVLPWPLEDEAFASARVPDLVPNPGLGTDMIGALPPPNPYVEMSSAAAAS